MCKPSSVPSLPCHLPLPRSLLGAGLPACVASLDSSLGGALPSTRPSAPPSSALVPSIRVNGKGNFKMQIPSAPPRLGWNNRNLHFSQNRRQFWCLQTVRASTQPHGKGLAEGSAGALSGSTRAADAHQLSVLQPPNNVNH